MKCVQKMLIFYIFFRCDELFHCGPKSESRWGKERWEMQDKKTSVQPFFSKHWPKVQYWFEFLSFFFQILVEQNILDLLFLANAMHWAHFCAQHPALGTLRAISNKRWAKVWWAGHTDLLYMGPGIQGILQKPQRISLHRDKALWNPTACSAAYLDARGRIAHWFCSGGGQGNDIQSLAPTITKFGSGLNCKGR